MQIISVLLSFLLALLPGVPFFESVKASADEYSVSQLAQDAITEDQLAQVAETLEALDAAEEQLDGKNAMDFFPLSLLGEEIQKLAVYYMVACLFSVNDGLSPLDAIRMQFITAGEAQIISRGIYTVIIDDYWKHDAAAHFMWGFSSTQRLSAEKARIHLINYELAGLLKAAAERFINERYNELLKEGQSEAKARDAAITEGGAYALNRREILLNEAGESFEAWNKCFGKSEVMDFWNDNKGQKAALAKGPLANSYLTFLEEWDAGSLTMGETEDQITMEKRQYIFENTSMWNPKVKGNW